MNKKLVLVACEESQAVTIALRARGHEAYSCDILPCSGGKPEWHIQGDVIPILTSRPWDMIIGHPPCTYITNAGVRHLHDSVSSRKGKKTGIYGSARWLAMFEGVAFFKAILDTKCHQIVVENPVPHKYAVALIGSKYSQLIQPYQFGHMERKATCLWLKGLPKLKPTNDVKDAMSKLPKNVSQRLHYLPPGPDRAKLRSKTFQGIAEAIAEQFGDYPLPKRARYHGFVRQDKGV